MITLRGHHLFCMTLFTGSGYDPEFTKNMQALRNRLAEPRQTVLLCGGADMVCTCCPNRQGPTCALGDENVQARDAAARRALDLRIGGCYTSGAIWNRLQEVTEQEFEAVCGRCRWMREGLCSYTLFSERAAALLEKDSTA